MNLDCSRRHKQTFILSSILDNFLQEKWPTFSYQTGKTWKNWRMLQMHTRHTRFALIIVPLIRTRPIAVLHFDWKVKLHYNRLLWAQTETHTEWNDRACAHLHWAVWGWGLRPSLSLIHRCNSYWKMLHKHIIADVNRWPNLVCSIFSTFFMSICYMADEKGQLL